MNREINIGQNIQALRKKNRVTQEQLADAVKVSSQAVSKWETGGCQPDTLTLPLIADYFNVSMDYLFYGCEKTYDHIPEKVISFVTEAHKNEENSFEEAVRISMAAQHGIARGIEEAEELKTPLSLEKGPLHILHFGGLSVCSSEGFSAVITEDFLNSVDQTDLKTAQKIFTALSDEDCLRVTVEIINFNWISHIELKEMTAFEEERLTSAIDKGIEAGFIKKSPTPHTILKCEYVIQRHHYNLLCLILASMKMIRLSLRGTNRAMRFHKLSIASQGAEVKPPDENE